LLKVLPSRPAVGATFSEAMRLEVLTEKTEVAKPARKPIGLFDGREGRHLCIYIEGYTHWRAIRKIALSWRCHAQHDMSGILRQHRLVAAS
jgi:hypothetical protein